MPGTASASTVPWFKVSCVVSNSCEPVAAGIPVFGATNSMGDVNGRGLGVLRGPNYENQFDLKPFKNVKVSAVDRITKLFHPKRNPSHDYVLLKRLGHHGSCKA